MFLLDTDVFSITSPVSRLEGAAVERWRAWTRQNANFLHMSVITLMEVRFGIERLQARGATRKATALAKWVLISETIYRDRLMWISPEIAHRAGALLNTAKSAGADPGAEDALIAATAIQNDMRLISRNSRHMNAYGIECVDPLDVLPPTV